MDDGRPQAPAPLSVRRNMLWNAGGSLVYLVSNWLTTVLVVVFGGTPAAGSLAVCMAVGNIMATIVLFRARPVQVSDVRGAYSMGDFVTLRLLSTGAAFAFCAVYCALTVAPQNYVPVFLYCLFKLTDSFCDVYHGLDQANGRLDYAGVSQLLRGVLVVASFVAGMAVFGRLWVAIALMTVSNLAVVMLYDLARSAQFGSLSPVWDAAHVRGLIATCVPGFVASLVVTLVVSLSRQVFGTWFGEDLLGLYAAVATPTVVVQALASYLYAPLLGPLAQNWAQGQTERIAKTLAGVLAAVCAVTLVGVGVGMLWGEPVLSAVYGERVGAHADLLTAMLACTAASACMYLMVDILVVLRDAVGSICSSVAALVACLCLMRPFFGEPNINAISLLIVASFAVGMAVALAFVAHDLHVRKANQ